MSGAIVQQTNYVRAMLGAREPALDAMLREALVGRGLRPMQVDDNAARVLQLLTLLKQPRAAIEIGTYFGFSTLHIARGLPPGAKLTSYEIDPELAILARDNVASAGLADQVEIVIGDAAALLGGWTPESVDLIFIDAAKQAYPALLKLCFPLLAKGGLLVADDAFAAGDFSGELRDSDQDATLAINTYNRAVLRSKALLSAFVGTNNGLMVSVKL
ncbi:O-methyltransferase [Bradyrhizobium sp. vgs-9]|uniref:O-methyltransferase n=1 Tax=Bradyrhizobium sp. vgs-9 TaxID=208389 RepID=UPI0035D50DF7